MAPPRQRTRVCLPLSVALPLLLKIGRHGEANGSPPPWTVVCPNLPLPLLPQGYAGFKLDSGNSVSCSPELQPYSLISAEPTDKPGSVAKGEFSWVLYSYSSRAEGPP